jgi:hypothetical protein
VSALPDSRALEDDYRREQEHEDRQRRENARQRPQMQHRLIVGFRDDDGRRYAMQGCEPGGVYLGRCVDCDHPVFGDYGALDAIRRRDAELACMYCNDQLRAVERFNQWGIVSEL